MRCKGGFTGAFGDRDKVNGGRIKERASRGDKRGSRLKFLPKADKIISVAKKRCRPKETSAVAAARHQKS